MQEPSTGPVEDDANLTQEELNRYNSDTPDSDWFYAGWGKAKKTLVAGLKNVGEGSLGLVNLLVPPVGTTISAIKEVYEQHRKGKGAPAIYCPSFYSLPGVWIPALAYASLLYFQPQCFAWQLPEYLKNIPDLDLNNIDNLDEKALGYLLFVVLLPIISKVATRAEIFRQAFAPSFSEKLESHSKGLTDRIKQIESNKGGDTEKASELPRLNSELTSNKQLLAHKNFFSAVNWKFGIAGVTATGSHSLQREADPEQNTTVCSQSLAGSRSIVG